MDVRRSPICTRRRSQMLQNGLLQSNQTTNAMTGQQGNNPTSKAEIIDLTGTNEKPEGHVDMQRSPVRTRRRSKMPQNGTTREHGNTPTNKAKAIHLTGICEKPQEHVDVLKPVCTRGRSKMLQNTSVWSGQMKFALAREQGDSYTSRAKISDFTGIGEKPQGHTEMPSPACTQGRSKALQSGLVSVEKTTFSLIREQDNTTMSKKEETRTSALEAKALHEKMRADTAEKKAARAEAEAARLAKALISLQTRVVLDLEKIEKDMKSHLEQVDRMDTKVEEMERWVDVVVACYEEDKKQMREEFEEEKRALASMYHAKIAATLQGLLVVLARLRGE